MEESCGKKYLRLDRWGNFGFKVMFKFSDWYWEDSDFKVSIN